MALRLRGTSCPALAGGPPGPRAAAYRSFYGAWRGLAMAAILTSPPPCTCCWFRLALPIFRYRPRNASRNVQEKSWTCTGLPIHLVYLEIRHHCHPHCYGSIVGQGRLSSEDDGVDLFISGH